MNTPLEVEGGATPLTGAEPKAPERSGTDLDKVIEYSEQEIRVRTDHSYRTFIGWVILFAVFVDILGGALVAPALPSLCSYAEGGPVDQITDSINSQPDLDNATRQNLIDAAIKETINPNAFQDPSPPVKFSLAMNLVLSAGQFGSAFGSLFFGTLCDRIGAKLPMQICVFAGLFGYAIIWIAGKQLGSYYLFGFGIFWNMFFGNVMGCAMVYLRMLFPPGAEREQFVQLAIACALVGGSVGALVVMPFVTNPKNGANFFEAIWVAVGITVVSFIALTVFATNLQPPKKDDDKDSVASSKNVANTKSIAYQDQADKQFEVPALTRRILIITIIASALDSAGDEGTRMARGTIVSNLFPEWSTTERQNILLLALLVLVMVTMGILSAMRRCMNLATIAVIGCSFTFAVQLVLMLEWGVAPYLVWWHFGKLFGFMSTIASGLIIQEVAPSDQLGMWNGRNDALTNLAAAFTPLIFAPIYDYYGNPRGQEMLAATAGVSFLAVLAYAPLVAMLPKTQDKLDEELGELQDLSVYDQMSDSEYAELPLQIVHKIEDAKLKLGQPWRAIKWGAYKAERRSYAEFMQNAQRDFLFYSDSTKTALSDKEALKELRNHFKMYDTLYEAQDNDKAKMEMGSWFADYLADAGYLDWNTNATLYKSMIMTAFPPLLELNTKKLEGGKMPLYQVEECMMKGLDVMDGYLEASNYVNSTLMTSDSANAMLRRR